MSIASLSVRSRLALSFAPLILAPAVIIFLEMFGAGSGAGFNATVGVAAAGILLGSGCAFWATRSTVRALQDSVALSRRLADGDLSQPLPPPGPGEFGELMRALHDMNERMFRVVSSVRTGTTTVASMSATLTNDNAALSTRTESQASSLEETASSMEELTSTVKQNAANAEEANRLAGSASQTADKGGQVVRDVVQTMGAIKNSSRKVVDIISVIDGIAFQTNILALNAAVEAARAGEQGRGFAVVASEVRNLAQRSAAAAKEIKQLIGDSVERVDAGAELVDQAGATMTEIIAAVEHVTAIMNEISAATREQSAGIEEINRAIVQVDATTQQNAALVEDSTRATTHLHEQAVLLTQAVGDFKLGAREFGNADEAVEMVRRGCAYAGANGSARMLEEVNKLGRGQFIERDLYLSNYSASGEVLAHGANPRLLGIEGAKLKDPDGRSFVKEMIDKARASGAGWVDYKWAHPVTKKLVVKSAYFEKAGDLVVACGFYKTQA